MSLFSFLLRWSWVIVIMTALGGVGGFFYLQYGPLPYKATATLMMRPQADPSGLPQVAANPQRSTVSALAIAGQAAAPSVYEATSRALAGQMEISSGELATLVQNGRILISPVGGSSFITVSASDPDPARAWLLADGYARGLMLDLTAQTRLVAEQQQADLRAQAEVLQQQLVSVPLHLNGQGAADTYSSVHARILQRLMDIEAQLQTISQSGPPVVRHGDTAAPVLAMSPSRVVVAGAAVGGTLGLMLAYVFELARQFFRRRAHLRQRRKAAASLPSTQTTPAKPTEARAPGAVGNGAAVNGASDPHSPEGGHPRWVGSAQV